MHDGINRAIFFVGEEVLVHLVQYSTVQYEGQVVPLLLTHLKYLIPAPPECSLAPLIGQRLTKTSRGCQTYSVSLSTLCQSFDKAQSAKKLYNPMKRNLIQQNQMS